MKSQNAKVSSVRTKSSKSNTNVDYDLVKRQLNEGNMVVSKPLEKPVQSGPTKSQINRLKKFYNTTRWLPNGAFTTYFGKPAFENYGYGNVNPVYGGLFYGNYMLSHNMNPIDGANHPPEKQVYSSAMMKSLQRKGIRKPSPPRKVPEEIRNTPEELEEIRTRCQIFQLPNPLPGREIVPPNLLKARYFRSGKNSPAESEEENEDEYEDWNVENVLSGKKNKKKKIQKRPSNVDPYKQGKVQLGKKKMKEGLDMKVSEEVYKKMMEKKMKRKMKEMGETGEEEEEEKSEREIEFEKQRDYYLQMLGEDSVKNLEDLSNLKSPEEQEKIFEEEKKLKMEEERRKILEEQEKQKELLMKENNICPYCNQNTGSQNFNTMDSTMRSGKLRKKENPALLPPNHDQLMDTFSNKNFVCCVHHNQGPFNVEDQDPREFQNMPPCMLNNIIPAGKPTTKNVPLNLLTQE
jgi:hypothetical protein